MDVKLSAEQSDLAESVRGLLRRHRSSSPAPGPAEADLDAAAVLEQAGFADVIVSGGSAVDAVLVIEAAAALAPGAPVAARALVAPLLGRTELPLVVALADRSAGAIARFAPQAGAFLVLAGEEAWLAGKTAAEVRPLATRWGYPVADVSVSRGDSLGPGSGAGLLNAWRIGLAAETGALMEAAVLHATRYVTVRHQFGKPIGALQSVQHRLARGYVLAQGTKWLARRAAWDPADTVAAAAAACYGADGVREVISTVQQVCGAIGITDEFGLTAYTARLALLQTELGGGSAHARVLARSRWSGRLAQGQAVAEAAGIPAKEASA